MTKEHTFDDQDKFIIVGCIGKTFGVRGSVKIHSYTQPADNIIEYSPWFMQIKGIWQKAEIEKVEHQTNQIIVKFAGLNTPEEAKKLTNSYIGIAREQLPELSTNEYYWSELEGLTVINQQGITLGQVSGFLETGANDVMLVKGDKVIAIPYIQGHYVNEINLEEKSIKVDWDADYC